MVLINLQYSPRTETMISAPPYLDNMRGGGAAATRRSACSTGSRIMRVTGTTQGISTCSAHSHGLDLAKRVHGWPRPRAVEICTRCGPPGPGAAG